MRSEIGSDYWLTEEEYQSALLCDAQVNLPYKSENVALTNLCRTGIELFLNGIDKKSGIALVPEFTCHSVIEPFVNHGYDIRGYKLKSDFSIDTDDLSRCVSEIKPDVIIIHSYFGFNTIPENIRELIPDAIIIEDLTQRFLSSFPLTKADCYVGSIRKWMPIPDGGFYAGSVRVEEPKGEEEVFSKLELKALLLKGKYMTGGFIEKNDFREAFANARQMLKKQHNYYKMSKLSRQIYNSIDINHWKSIRQENSRFLVEHLREFDFLELPLNSIDNDTVPFLVPVFVKNQRKEFQSFLAKNNIYATIIWTKPDKLIEKVSDTGQYIYDHILCFHCDHRYHIDDMQRIIETIRIYSSEHYEQ